MRGGTADTVIDIIVVGPNPGGVAVSPDGSLGYVVLVVLVVLGSGTVLVISLVPTTPASS